jgi:uncharacterized protein
MLIYIVIFILIVVLVLFVRRESGIIEVNHYKVPAGEGKLDREIKIVHLSDLHVSQWTTGEVLTKIVDRVNSENADYAVFTGDFVTHYREYIPICTKVLSRLSPATKLIGVLGNHDYWIDAEYLVSGLSEAGIRIMRNENFIDDETGIFWAGLDDPYTFHDDIEISLKGKPEGKFSVMLSHDPDIMEKIKDKNIDLVLSGHTHGGQIRFPLVGALYLPSDHDGRFDMGWFRENNTRLFVNRGLGVVFPPYRTFCRREIAVLRLVPEKGEVVKTGKEILQ